MRERGFNKADVSAQHVQQLIPKISRARLRKLLRNTEFMRDTGELLFVVTVSFTAPAGWGNVDRITRRCACGRRKPSRGREPMVDQKKLFDEIFELALQNNMNYLG